MVGSSIHRCRLPSSGTTYFCHWRWADRFSLPLKKFYKSCTICDLQKPMVNNEIIYDEVVSPSVWKDCTAQYDCCWLQWRSSHLREARLRRWHSIHIHILHKMHKQYATEEIEKKTCNNDLLLFSTENFNKQQKLIPKGSQSHSSDFTMRRNQGFFRPSISPKLAPRRHAIFFSADESRTGPSGKTFLQGVIWRRKWHCGNTAWLFI